MAEHNKLGNWGEELAVQHLKKKGYRIIDRNWVLGRNDLDIIAFPPDESLVAVIEVKTRRDKVFVDPTHAVSRQKRINIVNCANVYLKVKRMDFPTRFDVITVVGIRDNDILVNHYENAFDPYTI